MDGQASFVLGCSGVGGFVFLARRVFGVDRKEQGMFVRFLLLLGAWIFHEAFLVGTKRMAFGL